MRPGLGVFLFLIILKPYRMYDEHACAVSHRTVHSVGVSLKLSELTPGSHQIHALRCAFAPSVVVLEISVFLPCGSTLFLVKYSNVNSFNNVCWVTFAMCFAKRVENCSC